jgi:hypothetical protein
LDYLNSTFVYSPYSWPLECNALQARRANARIRYSP